MHGNYMKIAISSGLLVGLSIVALTILSNALGTSRVSVHAAASESAVHDHETHQEEPGHEEGGESHPGEEGHAGHADGEHGEERHDGLIHLSPAKMATVDLETGIVHVGSIRSTVSIPAESMLDPDEMAHVVPWVPGIAREIKASIGDRVAQGDLLAVIDSRELGQSKSDYLADLAMLELARKTYEREKRLFEDKISAEQDFLAAQQDYRAAQIAAETTRQVLFALGVPESRIAELASQKKGALTRYEIRAPFGGTIIERHVTRGEAIDGASEIFVIAGLDSIWVMGRLPERDLKNISLGQSAIVEFDSFPGEEFKGTLDYIGSVLDPRSRTVDVRMVIPNKERRIRAGMFGRMLIFMEEHEHDDAFLVPNEALQRTDEGGIVYLEAGEGEFKPVAVEVLHNSDTHTEVQGPLNEGDRVAVGDLFILKSEAGKEAMGGGHSH